MPDTKNFSPRSLVAQAGHFVDKETGAIVPPIEPSTTFARDEAYELVGGYSYSRSGGPSPSGSPVMSASTAREVNMSRSSAASTPGRSDTAPR